MLLELTEGRGKVWIAPQHVMVVCEFSDGEQGYYLEIQVVNGLVYAVNAALQDVLDRLAPFNRP